MSHKTGAQIRFRVRMLFKENQHVVKAHDAKEQLVMGYKVLNFSPSVMMIATWMQTIHSG